MSSKKIYGHLERVHAAGLCGMMTCILCAGEEIDMGKDETCQQIGQQREISFLVDLLLCTRK